MTGNLRFSLEVYDGPLDLLLTLLQKNKLDIFDIPISEITGQYMEELRRMAEADLEISTDFLLMASKLLLMKSRALLPSENPEEDEMTPEQLSERLAEYKRVKEAARLLSEVQFSSAANYFKLPEKLPKIPPENPLMEKNSLLRALFEVLQRVEDRKPPTADNFSGIVGREKISLPEKIRDVMSFVGKKRKASFGSIFEGCRSRGEIVTVFLALLHLVSRGRIKMKETKDDIFFTKTGEEDEE